MIIKDVNIKIKDLKGNDIKDQEVVFDKNGDPILDQAGRAVLKEGKPFTLSFVCIEALEATYRDETNLDAKTKVHRGYLAEEFFKAQRNKSELELESEDVTIVKDVIAKRWGVRVTREAIKIIDPEKKEVTNTTVKGREDKK